MGRHSVPDDDDVMLVAPTQPVVAVVAGGRHHRAEEDAEQEAGPPSRDLSGTHGDLRLLRESPALRARCAAAVIVPFLLYIATLVVLGRTGIVLVWLWIPIVTAGVGVGVFLDLAHRRAR